MSKKQESIATVTGKLGELGPHVIKADHTAYDYIRMDVDGQIVMVRDVRVSQTINSYLQPDMDVSLYVHGGDKQGNNGLVVGAEIEGKKIVIDDDLNVMIEGVNKHMRRLYIFLGLNLLPVPFVPLILLLAIPVMLIIFLLLGVFALQKRKLKSMQEEITTFFSGVEQPA
jgi:hypothetical protein